MSVAFALQTISTAPQLRRDQTFGMMNTKRSEALMSEFSDLFEWRDRLLSKHWPDVP